MFKWRNIFNLDGSFPIIIWHLASLRICASPGGNVFQQSRQDIVSCEPNQRQKFHFKTFVFAHIWFWAKRQDNKSFHSMARSGRSQNVFKEVLPCLVEANQYRVRSKTDSLFLVYMFRTKVHREQPNVTWMPFTRTFPNNLDNFRSGNNIESKFM